MILTMVIKLQIYTSRGSEGLNILSSSILYSSILWIVTLRYQVYFNCNDKTATFDLTLHYLDCDLLLAFLRVRLVLVSVAGLD